MCEMGQVTNLTNPCSIRECCRERKMYRGPGIILVGMEQKLPKIHVSLQYCAALQQEPGCFAALPAAGSV